MTCEHPKKTPHVLFPSGETHQRCESCGAIDGAQPVVEAEAPAAEPEEVVEDEPEVEEAPKRGRKK